MLTYKEYRDARQEEFNSLPIFFAFSRDQFRECMEERGLTENDTDKIYSLGSGGYYLRTDADVIREYFNKPDELSDLMKDYDFAKSAIYHEMCNHEYGINWQGDWDVMSCFGNVEYVDAADDLRQYWDALGWDDTQRRAYLDARRDYNKAAMENDWF